MQPVRRLKFSQQIKYKLSILLLQHHLFIYHTVSSISGQCQYALHPCSSQMSTLVEWITLCFTHWWPQMCHYSNIINFGSYRKCALQSNLIIPHCFLVHKKETIMQLLGYFIFSSAVANERATVMDASCQKVYRWSTNPIHTHMKDRNALMSVRGSSDDSPLLTISGETWVRWKMSANCPVSLCSTPDARNRSLCWNLGKEWGHPIGCWFTHLLIPEVYCLNRVLNAWGKGARGSPAWLAHNFCFCVHPLSLACTASSTSGTSMAESTLDCSDGLRVC